MPVLLNSNLAVGAFILFALYCFFVFPRVMEAAVNSLSMKVVGVSYLCLLCFVFSGTYSWELSQVQESLVFLALLACGVGLFRYATSERKMPAKRSGRY